MINKCTFVQAVSTLGLQKNIRVKCFGIVLILVFHWHF